MLCEELDGKRRVFDNLCEGSQGLSDRKEIELLPSVEPFQDFQKVPALFISGKQSIGPIERAI